MAKILNVILSGGSGTRLWPLSRQSKPKQFLRLFEGKSLFQHTLIRNRTLVNGFMLVTNSAQFDLAMQQADELEVKMQHRLIEPIGRNTAAAISLACLQADDDDILLVTPSDQMIESSDDYKQSVYRAIGLAQEGNLVTFGIVPTYPETGFGYIEHSGENVLGFHEKPDFDRASMFVSEGNFLWNSGMFCFKAKTMLDELKKYQRDIYDLTLNSFRIFKEKGDFSKDLFELIPSKSIDYAVMEKSRKIKVIPSKFKWTDLGSFKSLIDYHKDERQIDVLSKVIGVNCSSVYAISSKKVFGLGLENLILIEADDCILLLSSDESQGIKEVYELVKQCDKSLII